MRFVFDLLTSPLGLPIAWYWEYVIMSVIAGVSYRFSFASVGKMYQSNFIYGSKTGSAMHWIIRFITFITLWAFAYGIIFIIKWIKNNISLLLVIAIVAIVLIAIILPKRLYRKMR